MTQPSLQRSLKGKSLTSGQGAETARFDIYLYLSGTSKAPHARKLDGWSVAGSEGDTCFMIREEGGSFLHSAMQVCYFAER